MNVYKYLFSILHILCEHSSGKKNLLDSNLELSTRVTWHSPMLVMIILVAPVLSSEDMILYMVDIIA